MFADRRHSRPVVRETRMAEGMLGSTRRRGNKTFREKIETETLRPREHHIVPVLLRECSGRVCLEPVVEGTDEPILC
jgi:hypothetical protein